MVCQRNNSTFFSLIPKKDRSLKIKDFRLISFVTSIYKIMTKLLSRRLGEILGDTISEAHCAFVGGRQLIDAALVANEVVDDLRRRGRRGLILQLDFEKAYDRVNWRFLYLVMDRKGFESRCHRWISGCLSGCLCFA